MTEENSRQKIENEKRKAKYIGEKNCEQCGKIMKIVQGQENKKHCPSCAYVINLTASNKNNGRVPKKERRRPFWKVMEIFVKASAAPIYENKYVSKKHGKAQATYFHTHHHGVPA